MRTGKLILNGKKNGLLPAIVQDTTTGQVLMLAYMNRTAFQKTLKTKRAWFYSRSKKRLWKKGEESRNSLSVISWQGSSHLVDTKCKKALKNEKY